MRILAVDVATKSGFACDSWSGSVDFKPKRGESEFMRIVRFKARVREIIDSEKIEVVAYERPAGQHKASIIVASEMIGVLKDLCMEKGVEVANYAAKEIKKFATGNGNANKELMIVKAKEKFNKEIVDDNEADALWLLELAKSDLI